MPIYNAPGGGSSITVGDTSIAITDSGTGHAAVNVDGSEVARFTGDGLLLTDADNGDPVLTIRNTGTGANEPEIRFERTHPAVSGSSPDIGHIKFLALDDAENNTLYANIFADLTSNTNGTEDGRLIFEIAIGGTTDVEVMRLQNDRIVFNEEGKNIDFRVESDGNVAMLFVDGGNDRVGIGTSAPQKTLHVTGGALFGSVTGTYGTAPRALNLVGSDAVMRIARTSAFSPAIELLQLSTDGNTMDSYWDIYTDATH